MDKVLHPIKPIFNKDSRILILGSFPSVKSREGQFFYHHPQNRFWKVLATIYGQELPKMIPEKINFLIDNQIAVWDVIHSCEIVGSSDSSIKNVVPNDIGSILKQASIERIYANGNKSYELYKKYCYPVISRDIIKLPSTSPANAAFSLDRLVKEWSCIRGENNE